MRSCFLPKCDAMNRSWPTRPMFAPPKDPGIFEQWKKVLPKKRQFKRTDKVCLKHFADSDLMFTYDTIVNGDIVQIPRGRPKLNITAIPCKLLTDCDYPKRGRKFGSKVNKEVVIKKVLLKKVKSKKNAETNDNVKGESIEIESSEEINESMSDECCEESVKQEMDEIESELLAMMTDDAQNDKISKKNIDNNKMKKTEDSNGEKTKKISKAVNEKFVSLYEDIFEVELPSTLWGIHRDPSCNFIALTYFDPKLHLTSKSIILNSYLKASIYIFDKQIKQEKLNVNCSMEDIDNILAKVNKVRLCISDKKLFGSCELTLDDDDEDRCKTCLQLACRIMNQI